MYLEGYGDSTYEGELGDPNSTMPSSSSFFSSLMDDIDEVRKASTGRSGFDGPPIAAPALTDRPVPPPGVDGGLTTTSESRDLLDIADGGRLTAAA